jgi:hypothetical protein
MNKMYKKVKLQDIIDGMEMQIDGTHTYLNIKTGEVISVSQEALWAAEEDEPFDHLPEWQQQERIIAIDILEDFFKYQELPTKFDINEYEIMENFCFTIKDQKMRSLLLNAIRGKGAFRRFKDNIQRFGIADKWYEYRDEKLKEFAIEWCEESGIEYIK